MPLSRAVGQANDFRCEHLLVVEPGCGMLELKPESMSLKKKESACAGANTTSHLFVFEYCFCSDDDDRVHSDANLECSYESCRPHNDEQPGRRRPNARLTRLLALYGKARLLADQIGVTSWTHHLSSWNKSRCSRQCRNGLPTQPADRPPVCPP
jgi:hypothetical protein